MKTLPIIDVGGVLVSSDILTECFCCDLDACHGACCVEGDAGAPVTLDEVAEIENMLDDVWQGLSASAQNVIDRHGVAYTDVEGALVTSIVDGKDCVFTCHENGCCLCLLEKYRRNSGIDNDNGFCKPISCALYPIREVQLTGGITALNYHRWNICSAAVEKGRRLALPVYRFLKEPLTRRFGKEWYDELVLTADELKKQGYI